MKRLGGSIFFLVRLWIEDAWEHQVDMIERSSRCWCSYNIIWGLTTVLAYFYPKKYRLRPKFIITFTYVIKLFSPDVTMYRKLIFLLPMKILKKNSKVGYSSKIEEIFPYFPELPLWPKTENTCWKLDWRTLRYIYSSGMLEGGRQGGGLRPPPQFLADQLTLSRPRGAHYPHPVLLAPPDFQTLRHACSVHESQERVCQSTVDTLTPCEQVHLKNIFEKSR